MTPAQGVWFDPYVTPVSYHQEQRRRSLSATLLLGDCLVQRPPVACAQSLATYWYLSISLVTNRE